MGATTEGTIADRLRARVVESPFHTWLGVRVVDAGQGWVRLELDAGQEHRNLQGLVHGGLLATLADTAMGLAIRTSVEPGRRHVTIAMHVQFMRPGRPGRIEASGRAVRVGRQIAHAEAALVDGDGRELARAQGTYSVTSLPQ